MRYNDFSKLTNDFPAVGRDDQVNLAAMFKLRSGFYDFLVAIFFCTNHINRIAIKNVENPASHWLFVSTVTVIAVIQPIASVM